MCLPDGKRIEIHLIRAAKPHTFPSKGKAFFQRRIYIVPIQLLQ